MVITLYNFSKKRNSTTVPSGSGDSTFTGTLRDGCTVLNPVISFAINRQASPTIFTYAHIPQWHRYYYIQDWKWENGLWTAYMEVDTMGSYKNEIGRSECYVLRAKSQHDPYINDAMYPTLSYSLGQCGSIETTLYDVDSETSGTYIIGVMGKEAKNGCTIYYALTPAEMKTFRENMFTDNYMGIMEITAELKKALVNPAQYIVSANWFPYNNIGGESVSKIALGWWDVPTTAKVITQFVISRTQDFLIYAHSTAQEQADTYSGLYLFSSPYSSYTLTIPPFGEIELDPQIIAYGMEEEGGPYSCTVHAILNTDLMTGDGTLYLYTDDITGERQNGELLAFRSTKMCAPVQVGQITSNVSGAMQGIGNSVFNGSVIAKAASSTTLGVVAGVAGAVLSGSENMTPRTRTLSLNGGMALFKQKPIFNVRYNPIVETSVEENGRPLFQTKIISSLEGYIKTMNADVIIADATDFEQEQIRATMNGGFFYE